MLTLEKVISSYNRIRYYFIKELNKCEEFNDFTPNEISILLALDNNPNINTASDLCVALSVSKGLISRSIDSLIMKDLIITHKHPSDKRIICLSLTDEAKVVAKAMFNKMLEFNEKFNQEFSKEEIEIVDKVFIKFIDYFEKKEGYKLHE